MSRYYWDKDTVEISAKNEGLTAVRIILLDVTLSAVTLTAGILTLTVVTLTSVRKQIQLHQRRRMTQLGNIPIIPHEDNPKKCIPTTRTQQPYQSVVK